MLYKRTRANQISKRIYALAETSFQFAERTMVGYIGFSNTRAANTKETEENAYKVLATEQLPKSNKIASEKLDSTKFVANISGARGLALQ